MVLCFGEKNLALRLRGLECEFSRQGILKRMAEKNREYN